MKTGPATGLVDAGNINMQGRTAGPEPVRSRAGVEAFSSRHTERLGEQSGRFGGTGPSPRFYEGRPA
ncbi:hypothetical protein SAMN04487966_10526 [Micrococcus terreus]|uniref:Uncharacterized protein n=1 Tax=Micrococcus terreus TaxID=574650 RepID=A0A1I7MLM7_9MICC|nr:hypothetical protein SAMN04487966_10526 [Micrococcus terreus]